MLTGSFDPVSNREDFIKQFDVIDDDTRELVDISGATEFCVEIHEQDDDQQNAPSSASNAFLTADLENGKLEIVSPGVAQWQFTPVDMSALASGYFTIKCRITINGVTKQLMSATLPVIDG